MAKFRMLVEKDDGSGDPPWWEEYDKPGGDAKKIARGIVEYWNATLRDNEKRRRLLAVEPVLSQDGLKENKC